MKQYLTLLLLFSFWTHSVFAQKARDLAQAGHFIKLANTLRALDKPQDAINLLERALPTVRGKDVYLEAVTCELLGLAYNEQGNSINADYYLKVALSRYKKLNYVASAWAVNELSRDIAGKNLYAGIQFGSSDVKLAIFKTKYESDFYEKDIKSKVEVPNNVTLFADASKAFRAERDALRVCLDSIRRYNIPNERIFIVFSSDIKEGFARSPENKRRLYEQLSRALPNGMLRIDTTLTSEREAELFTIGAIPRKVWPTTSSLNIGSTATLGGYFDDGVNRTFHPIDIPVGLNTLVSQIESKRSANLDVYKREAPRVIKAIADSALAPRLKASGLQQRKTVGLGGDIALAIVTYLHPERAGITAVPITKEDIDQFKRQMMDDYRALTHPDLGAIDDPAVRDKVNEDLRVIQNQVNEKQLIAGVLWLESLMNAYSTKSAPKRFVFVRNADIGWVTGKFLETINYEYESTIAKGAIYTR